MIRPRELALNLTALALGPAGAGVAAALGAGVGGCVAGAAVGTALAGVVVAIRLHRRDERGAAVNAEARRLLGIGLEDPGSGAVEGHGRGMAGGDDLTELRSTLTLLAGRLEDEVKTVAKQSKNLAGVLDALDEPVMATDNDDNILLCNRAAEVMLGAPPGSLLGRPMRHLFTQPDVIRMHMEARAGRVSRARVRLITAQGLRTFQVSAAPLPTAWGAGIFGTVLALRDVTELAQAIQLKTDFVANASHELRTPLAAVRMAVETMQEGGTDDRAMTEKLLGIAAGHITRLEDLLRDLMDLSRLESTDVPLTVGTVGVEGLIASVAGAFDAACAARSLTIRLAVEPQGLSVRSDERLIALTLRNLIENATKFAHEGTEVRVAAASAPERGWVRFEVRDKGVGIPLAQQDRVFERFYQVDPARSGTGASSRRGTGLGLSIVKHAVKVLGGRVGIDSIWGEGTTVWFEVPASLDAATQSS